MEEAYKKGEVHPKGLKDALVEWIDQLIAPVRNHFQNNQTAKSLLEDIRKFTTI